MARALFAPRRHVTRATAIEDEWRSLDPNIPAEVLQRISGRGAQPTVERIEVLECNMHAVQVFRLCQWDRISLGGGMGPSQLLVTSIAAGEIRNVCDALAVPFDADLLDRVRVLEGTARPMINDR